MTQPQNNITTLFFPDPNGGRPQMFKVMGSGKLPLQLATAAGTAPGTSTIKTFIKNSATGEQIPPGTIIQGNRIGNKQIIAVPTKSGINLQGIRPVVVPVSSVQLKSTRTGEQQYSASIIAGRSTPTVISSPMVIRTQTGSLAVTTSSVSNSVSTPIQLPQITVNKQTHQQIVSASGLQAQFKPGGPAVTSNRQTFTVKTQQAIPCQKQPELIILPHKHVQDATSAQKLRIQQPVQKQLQHPPQSQGISPPKSLMSTSILDHSGSRKRHDFDFDYSVESKRRKTEKGGKGLRHFSMKVCEKVQAKGTTSYNEVADELVNEFSESNRSVHQGEGANYDQKNIRRRVYDALNVLMAMNIISKEKKEIHWLGLPTNSLQECRNLEQERKKRLQKIRLKTQQLQDLILQQIAFKNLVERNRKLEKVGGVPSPNSAIQLPFIIVNTSKKTVIDCSISNDKTEYLFNFDDTFEIHDDIEVLKRMGMALGLEKGQCSSDDLEKAKSLVPKALESYVIDLAHSCSDAFADAKFDSVDELGNNTVVDDLDAAISSICSEEFTFERAGNVKESLRSTGTKAGSVVEGNMSRHSSLLSLSQDQRTESVSPSSFGEDYDDDNIDESDVEIN